MNDYGLKIPSPFSNLTLNNSEIDSMSSWELNIVVGGDSTNEINIAAFEALIYSAAQASLGTAGIPVSFMFGWLDQNGNIESYLSYQGFSLKFSGSTQGQYMVYKLTGYASLAIQTHMPVLNIPAVEGFVQPSAVFEALAKAVKADYYYDLDIDHNDSPTLVSHGAMNTSFNAYVNGTFTGQDNYNSFPGLVTLSKSYNGTRDASSLDTTKSRSLSSLLNNLSVTNISKYLKAANVDTSPQVSSFSYWVDEPTMTSKGVIHYKSNAGLLSMYGSNILQYGTSTSNILALNGSYDGVAYNMSDMSFSTLGFSLDGSGNTIVENSSIVNSWSSSLAKVFQTANIINDVNALASQFSGDFQVTIIGDTKRYELAQPVSLIVMSGNTLSPISGIYNIMSVSHQISVTYTTVLTLKRLEMSSANQVAAGQGILVRGSSSYPMSSYTTSSNIKSTNKVDFGEIYPTFQDMYIV